MRGILINPWDRTITEVEVPCERGNYKAIHAALSQPETDADPGHTVTIFQIISLGTGRGREDVSLHIDEEGALVPGVPMFTFQGGTVNFAGRGLILGGDGERTVATSLRLDDVTGRVNWLDVETTGDFEEARNLTGEEAKAYLAKHGGPIAQAMGVEFCHIGGQPITAPRGTWAAEQAKLYRVERQAGGEFAVFRGGGFVRAFPTSEDAYAFAKADAAENR